MLKLKRMSEADCLALEKESLGMIEIDWADGIKVLRLKLDGVPTISLSQPYGTLEAHQKQVQKKYTVSWNREVDSINVALKESFDTLQEREDFIYNNLDGLEDIELSEVEI